MMYDLVSIMIPCYNGESFLGRLFSTIMEQTHPYIQIIFVNDGSTDKTAEIAKEYQRIFAKRGIEFVYVYQENQGQAAAINTALKLIRGEYCMWLDAEDYITKDHIEKKYQYLEAHKDKSLVLCRGIKVKEDTLEKIGSLGHEPAIGTLFEDILFGLRSCCNGGLSMVRTEYLLEQLDERGILISPVGQNLQLLLPITLSGKDGQIEDELFLYVHREKSHSHSFSNGIDWKNRLDGLLDLKTSILDCIRLDEKYRDYLIRLLHLKDIADRMAFLDEAILETNPDYVKHVVNDYVNLPNMTESINGRTLCIWGNTKKNRQMAKYISRFYDVGEILYIESNPDKLDVDVVTKDMISRDDMYIIIPLAVYNEIIEELNKKGFETCSDYFYPKYFIQKALREKRHAITEERKMLWV